MEFLIALVSGFASGVFLRSLFNFGWEPIVFAIVLAIIFIGAYMSVHRSAYTTGAIFCLFIALGMTRALVADTPLPETFASQLRHRVSYEGTVVSDPDLRDANQRFEVRVSNGDQSTILLVVASRTTTVMVGDSVYAAGTLLTPEPFASEDGRIFRYDKYLQRDGVRFILNYASIRVTNPAPWYSIPATLARVKHAFLDGLAVTMPEPYSSLAGGVVIGGKSGLGTELQAAFVRTGLVQIIVLSGYNVMVVAEWIMAALALTPLSKKWGAVAGALAVLIFVGVAGASSTAVRAMLMAFIALYARATGRSYTTGRALLVVIVLMLIWNPLYLVFDPGFGLSVAATAGLIWLAPIIETLLTKQSLLQFLRVRQVQRRPESPSGDSGSSETLSKIATGSVKFSFWRNAIATTLAAQIAVLPLLLYDTGNLSLVSVPANLITMPVVPFAMSLSLLAGFFGIIFGTTAPIIGIVLAYPAYLANAYLIYVAQKAATFPFAAFSLPAFSGWLVLIAYAAIIFIASSKRFSTALQLRFARKAST